MTRGFAEKVRPLVHIFNCSKRVQMIYFKSFDLLQTSEKTRIKEYERDDKSGATNFLFQIFFVYVLVSVLT